MPRRWSRWRRARAWTWSSSDPRGRWSTVWPTRLRAAGLPVFGPGAAAARLEGSKAFCREICEAAGVPMARGAAYDDPVEAMRAARRLGGRVAIKADGLAGGKGVVVCADVRGGGGGHPCGDDRGRLRACRAPRGRGGGAPGPRGQRHHHLRRDRLPGAAGGPRPQAPARWRRRTEHRRHGCHQPARRCG